MKHTHRGHCQLCDRPQAVNPKTGLLAKHGYTKRWGFFQGTCPGSDKRPYEITNADIPSVIDDLRVEIAHLQQLRQIIVGFEESDPLKAYATFRRYLPKELRRYGEDPQEYRHVAGHYEDVDGKWSDGTPARFVEFVADEPVKFKDGTEATRLDHSDLYRHSQGYKTDDFERGAAGVAAAWREKEIRTYETKIARVDEYKKWLTERHASWKRAGLVPVGA